MASSQVRPDGNAVGVLTSTQRMNCLLGRPWYSAISRLHSGQLPSKKTVKLAVVGTDSMWR